MLNKLYHKGAEIKSAFLKGVMVFGSSEVPVEPSGDMGLAKDYSGTGWYKATDTGTVFSKDVPELETMVFEEGGLEYVSVYTSEDANLYGARAATSNVTDMSWAMSNVGSVGDITSWDVSNVTNMYSMFSNFWGFNQDISKWDVSSVTNMGSMFSGVNKFDQDISGWDVSNVTDMDYMFRQNAKMNQDLSGWCVTNILVEPLEFSLGNTVWVKPKPVWGTCPRGEDGSVPETPEEPDTLMGLRADYSGTGWYKATDTGTVFCKDVPELETHVFSDSPKEYVSVYADADARRYGARAATSNLTDISYCFFNNASFNEDISSWDVSNVTNMALMFNNASSFNQDLSMWCVSLISTKPYDFDTSATAWTLPQPVWGTCPRGENTP